MPLSPSVVTFEVASVEVDQSHYKARKRPALNRTRSVHDTVHQAASACYTLKFILQYTLKK